MAATAAAEADGGGAVTTRLFVGGLAEGVSAADLEAVFGSIGRVAGVEFVRTSGRSFAYVDFQCPSHKALAKLFSTYNGCKWKGGKLKLEKAKEHYLVRLKREWEQEAAAAAAAAAAQEMPAEDSVDKQEEKEKRKLEKDALESSKLNIYFPRLRKLKPLPFKGSGKHKYSFRNIEVPSYPIHFCDCEEHCGPPEKANEEYAAVLNRVAYEKERNIMNSVMSKLFEKDTEQIDSSEVQKQDVVNIMEPSDAETEPSNAETEPSDTETEPSDSDNNLPMEETTETPEEDLDDLQMEETDDPSEEELDDDDLVINIAPRKANNSAAQLNRANQAVNKDERFRKRQHFDEISPQKKRQKSEDLSEPRNKKQSTSMNADRRTTGKSLPSVAVAIQNEQKSSVLSGKGTHGFSSVLDRAKSSAGLQGVDALTGRSTKNEGSQNELPTTEPKRGSVWTQKSAWRDLVGGMGATSFSISQILPNINPAPPKLEPATETSVACTEARREVTSLGMTSLGSPEAITQPSAEQNSPSSTGTPSAGTTVGSAGHETRGCDVSNKVEEPCVVPKITISEVCPFMRNEESVQQWSKAKKVLTGFSKRGDEKKAGSSNSRRGKPQSRRG
ncbi:protein REPRESSOR OF SILENCING 3 [Triticum aestivum]|uniref:protein REPRESSOR OF SILENCING 3 n=1 Tax=Triticum aestivum TaxID=4565 RepID=UPI001D00FF66|nr:protein REPRESSOR OF SILENCING 3-like [Triticum aestivum]